MGRSSDLIICDLDGDGLKDLVLVNDLDVSVHYQDPIQGFNHEPQQTYRLDHRPCVVWAARLGRTAESLLVMTSEGVNEICFTNRTSPPSIRQIVRQRTVIPETPVGTNAVCLPLSLGTARGWPLLLVPASEGLEVWEHQDEWRQVRVIAQATDSRLRPEPAAPGYARLSELYMSVADANGDGLDDLMVRRSRVGQTNVYSLYLQQTNGSLGSEPALIHEDGVEPFSWLCWTDINRDGKVDLIKSRWLNAPSFVPGIPSGKALVSVYLADEHGRIPAEPQQVFRKNDWVPALPVVDVDSDGYPDLVLGYFQMDSREGLRKQITAKKIDYTLRFHFYRPGLGFPAQADCQRDIVIHLDQADSPLDWSLPQNFKRFVNLGGDFSGERRTGLVVRDHSDRISVYFFVSRQRGFSPEADLRFSCSEAIEEWRVIDLNNDGVSDLVVKLANQTGLRVLLSQK